MNPYLETTPWNIFLLDHSVLFETESYYVDQASFKFTILLPQPPLCWANISITYSDIFLKRFVHTSSFSLLFLSISVVRDGPSLTL